MPKASVTLGAIAVVLVASGCSQGAAPSGGAYRPPEQHHQPTQPPPRDYPAATPYDGVTYEDPGVNPYVDTSRDRESTFALDVDTASYGIAARYIGDGNLPDPASVRVEEFVNAFEQGYPSPEEDAFAIVADGGPTPFLESGEQLLRIGIKARDVARRERPDASLTFVIDVSGSMAREDRLELVKGALRVLVDHLRRSDRVPIVVFGSDARVVLESTPGTPGMRSSERSTRSSRRARPTSRPACVSATGSPAKTSSRAASIASFSPRTASRTSG